MSGARAGAPAAGVLAVAEGKKFRLEFALKALAFPRAPSDSAGARALSVARQCMQAGSAVQDELIDFISASRRDDLPRATEL